QRLGLHVVARLAARHGIEVSLTPTPGCGVTAAVVLPPTLFADAEPGPDELVGDATDVTAEGGPVVPPPPGAAPPPPGPGPPAGAGAPAGAAAPAAPPGWDSTERWGDLTDSPSARPAGNG